MKTQNQDQHMVISYLTMRKTVGWLGMLLPFALFLSNYCINTLNLLNNEVLIKVACYKNSPSCQCANGYIADASSWKSSISHYYYTTVGELFTGVLCAVALFLISYKGYSNRSGDKWLSDNATSNLAGIFALGVVIFPTSSEECISDNLRIFLSSDLTGYIHFAFAALFFFMLAMMSIINFRRTENVDKKGDTARDTLYLVCGIIMLVCLVLIFLYAKFLAGSYEWLDDLRPVFSLEALALQAFGLSWLSKGKVDFYFVLKLMHLKK